MKHIKLLSIGALLGVGGLFFSSCGGTDETPKPKPVLNFLAGDEYLSRDGQDFAANTPFKIAITASHTDNITSFKIIQSLDGSTDVELFDSVDIKTKVISEYIFSGTTGAKAGTEIYLFTLADKNGLSTTKSIKLNNLGDPGKDLRVETKDNNGESFRVWNFRGPKAGAYGITAGSNIFAADFNSDKDIQDSISNTEPSWPARWTSRNGTTFKKLASGDWNRITNDATIVDAWNKGGIAQTFVSITDGDVYVLNLAGADTYSLVRVTAVDKVVKNSEYVQFEYKLQVK